MILLDLAIQRGPADAEQLGGLGHVVARAVEGFGDKAFFPLVDPQRFQLAAARIAEREVMRQKISALIAGLEFDSTR